ncbi:MAG: hypothetical protein QXL17_02640 [Candidatus Thermoplasmatota archaeon]
MAQEKITSVQIDTGTTTGKIPVFDESGKLPIGAVPPTVATDATNKAYVDALVTSSTTWRNPIVDPDLVGIAPSVPGSPAADTVYIAYGGSYPQIWGSVSGVVSGDILTRNNAGTDWILIKNLTVGDRFIIAGEHGTPDGTITGMGFQKNDLLQYTGGNPTLAGSWSTPEGDPVGTGITVLCSASNSNHNSHTYLYNAGTDVWYEVSGPGAVNAGNGLSYSGNTLNVGAGTGISVAADLVSLDLAYTDNRYVNISGDTMTGFLTLNANPTTALHAATKQYVDTGLATKQNNLGYTPVNKAGDSMSGMLSINTSGTSALGISGNYTGFLTSFNNTSTGYTMYVRNHSGAGDAIFAEASGTGTSILGYNTDPGGTGNGVFGYCAGSGQGVVGMSASGYGVHGQSNTGVGVSGSTYGLYGVSAFNGGSAGSALYALGGGGSRSCNLAIASGSTAHSFYSSSATSRCVYGSSGISIAIEGAGASYDFYASGGGTNYGPFTGAHDGLVTSDFNGVPGDIVIDTNVVHKSNISNCIFENQISTSSKDKRAVGVLVSIRDLTEMNIPSALTNKTIWLEGSLTFMPIDNYEELMSQYKLITFNAIGEGQINVCKEGGNIEIGDYICTSSVPGKGMKQPDDVYHNYTVARARESVNWSANDNSFKQIACIYLCG